MTFLRVMDEDRTAPARAPRKSTQTALRSPRQGQGFSPATLPAWEIIFHLESNIQLTKSSVGTEKDFSRLS